MGAKAESATTTPQPKSIIYEEGPYFGVNSASKNKEDVSRSFSTSREQQQQTMSTVKIQTRQSSPSKVDDDELLDAEMGVHDERDNQKKTNPFADISAVPVEEIKFGHKS